MTTEYERFKAALDHEERLFLEWAKKYEVYDFARLAAWAGWWGARHESHGVPFDVKNPEESR